MKSEHATEKTKIRHPIFFCIKFKYMTNRVERLFSRFEASLVNRKTSGLEHDSVQVL